MTGEAEALRLEARPSLAGIPAAAWNALVGPDDPFLEHEFLSALEDSGVVGEGTSWVPRHVLAWRGDRLVGAVPFYLRWDSYGEYIFDFGWAEAWSRAGLRYYPKGVAAVPFTPVTGARLLVGRGEGDDVVAALADALLALAGEHDLSGVHVLFCRDTEQQLLEARGFLPRLTHQYHWENRGYATFDDWLADLRSKKRKQVLQERAAVREQGIKVEVLDGERIQPDHVDAIWRFYLATAERKWSQPYLNRETFEQLARTWKHRLVLVLASLDGRYVAGTFNVRGENVLLGRYWGAVGEYPCLHFECCYWRLVDYAIDHGMRLVEAGAQGEHKFLRGFNARPTYSAHWLAHPGGRSAVAQFLEREREQGEAVIQAYNRASPVKSEREKAGQ